MAPHAAGQGVERLDWPDARFPFEHAGSHRQDLHALRDFGQPGALILSIVGIAPGSP